MTHLTITNSVEREVMIEASMFNDLLSYQAKHLQVLEQMIRAVAIINADTGDERLGDVQVMLEALAVGAAGVLQEQRRVVQTQAMDNDPGARGFNGAH